MPQPSLLPLTEPHKDVILWVSQKVNFQWKFFARYLGLEEDVIKLVPEEGSREEACYSMLNLWRQHHVDKYNYRTLGTALRNDVNSIYLYSDFVKKISQYENI